MNKVVVMEQPSSIKQHCSKIQVDSRIIPTRLQDVSLIVRNPCCSVYKGVYNGETVAVKLFELENQSIQGKVDDVALRRYIFTEEVSVWRELDHPNITKFVGEIRDDLASKVHHQLPKNTLCCGIVMEYLCHGTLRRHLELSQKKEKKLPLKEVIKLALDLAQGLEYLHSKNIVHRDVKTENLLLDDTNMLKITDFGTAIREDPNSKSLCSRVRTIRYMAPEVLNKEKYDRKCDVFSFGICLWEIYCCETPYAVLSPFELECDDIMKNKRPEIPKKCPKSIAKIMKSCWEEDTHRRPEMKEIVVMLKKMKASLEKPVGCFYFL